MNGCSRLATTNEIIADAAVTRILFELYIFSRDKKGSVDANPIDTAKEAT